MNSAQRIEKLFTQLKNIQPPTVITSTTPTAIDAWTALFDRHGPADENLEEVAVECSMAVKDELIHLSVLLREQGVPTELYLHHLTHLRTVTAPRLLHVDWLQLSKMVREEQLVMLMWAGFVLGDDSDTDITMEVDRLAAEIDRLIADVESSGFPISLRMFVLLNLRSIRGALWRYKVAGVEPLRRAMQTVNGTNERQVAELEPLAKGLQESEKNLLSRVGGIITSVANACDVATKIQGGLVLGAAAAAALGLTS